MVKKVLKIKPFPLQQFQSTNWRFNIKLYYFYNYVSFLFLLLTPKSDPDIL